MVEQSSLPAWAAGAPGIDILRRGPGVSNHPVNVRPSNAVHIPDDWPLRPDGTIGCLTCHDGLPTGRSGDAVRLRDFDLHEQDSIQFCAKCHESGGQRTAASMHWLAMRQAHVSDSSIDTRSAGSLDAESRRCMECHDGVTAGEFNNSTPWNRGGSYTGDRRRNHPVGVPYPRGLRRGRDPQFRMTGLLPKQVRLPNGRVGCISCHDLYATEPAHLTVPIRDSALCLTCHNMD
jgi:predicted CXXCH cytochrome family protein